LFGRRGPRLPVDFFSLFGENKSLSVRLKS
jgi:hypothetical protein